ncbi:GNAT family acetyltransferase [Coccidioides immitis RS]|uniref:GNAT family acetyltransferase n=2 Tax=Coccidioides immitis TaxID=5501 RepID=J3K6Q3_COCIM|nr:GNAT family acetyltransferase [Coccidioides immitis RS]EAS30278.3 GNAT family acetyltransferase [Coccidioides immitis RS]KMP02835.1 hypothetical protein CIRG_02527 [Coccidioides immitis RMSCC 2394]TPX23291.1 hypothetical protein DIZ76_012618 [Coccidioides immitis]
MRLELQPVTDTGFAEVVAGMWTSFENPFSGLLRVVAPILNDDRAASFATNIQVQLAQHKATQPESHWIKVVDLDAGGELAGAARWLVYERDPFKEGEEVVADWWPEGSMGREFATKTLQQLDAPRGKMARRPHLYLNVAFTLPAYRRHGVATMLVDWGIQKADSMGLECWLDASDSGRPVYEKKGFIYIMDQALDPDMDEKKMSAAEREELMRLREMMPPTHLSTMWRPKGGKYSEGATVKPWETASNEA